MSPRIYVPIESTTCFKFTNLVAKVKDGLVKRYPEAKGDEFETLMYKALRTFKLNKDKPNEQSFDYMYLPNHLGGVRWYVKCPRCGKPCVNLYYPDKHKDREHLYLCKRCHKLKNTSMMLGSTKKYVKVIKPLRQLEKIRSLLLKKSMTPAKAQPLLDEYRRIEDELAASPEYRLWKFQKEHNIE